MYGVPNTRAIHENGRGGGLFAKGEARTVDQGMQRVLNRFLLSLIEVVPAAVPSAAEFWQHLLREQPVAEKAPWMLEQDGEKLVGLGGQHSLVAILPEGATLAEIDGDMSIFET